MKLRLKNSLTLVEVVVVLLLITLLLAVALPAWDRKQQEEWQAVADAEPERVFTIECYAEKESFLSEELVTLLCTVRNTTRYALEFKFKAFSTKSPGMQSGKIPLWMSLKTPEEQPDFSAYVGWQGTGKNSPYIQEILPGEAAYYRLALIRGRISGKGGKEQWTPMHRDITGSNTFSAFVTVADKDFYWTRKGRTFKSPVFEYRVVPADRRDNGGKETRSE